VIDGTNPVAFLEANSPEAGDPGGTLAMLNLISI
jgi:hypothetical protein